MVLGLFDEQRKRIIGFTDLASDTQTAQLLTSR